MTSLSLNPVSKELLFKGRPGDPRLGEWVEVFNEFPEDFDPKTTVFLYGCPDDTGVKINKGRAGASGGPDGIRKFLYKMSFPMDFPLEKRLRLIDLGNIRIAGKIADTHAHAGAVAEKISSSGATLIALGGGHDFAAPNVMGWAKGKAKGPCGLFNVDPHLDFRPLENGEPHSGSPFRQILESKLISGKNFVEFGARSNRNSREHFEACKKTGAKIRALEQLRALPKPMSFLFQQEFLNLSKKTKSLALTLDMDACSEGEGTSAAPVIGFSAQELYLFSALAGSVSSVSYFEIAEVAPGLDPSERTSRIGAELVFSFLYQRAEARNTAKAKPFKRS